MKVKPEIFLAGAQEIKFKKILVTGSDESFINYVTEFIIKKYKQKNYFIDTSGSINPNLVGDLFSDNKILFILRDYSLKKEMLEINSTFYQSVIISSTNNKKINAIKGGFLKSKDSLLIECYALNRSGKEMVIKNFIDTTNVEISKDVFWYILDSFENNYVLLNQQLQLLSLLDKKNRSISDIEQALFVENKVELNKMIFHIFKNNKYIINIFNKNIYSQTDFYVLLSSLKVYLGIIGGSSDIEEALKNFPKYLFNERDIFIKLYSCLNKEKVKKIYNNIFKVENLVRKNSNLYFIIGLRFLINTKKIITS